MCSISIYAFRWQRQIRLRIRLSIVNFCDYLVAPPSYEQCILGGITLRDEDEDEELSRMFLDDYADPASLGGSAAGSVMGGCSVSSSSRYYAPLYTYFDYGHSPPPPPTPSPRPSVRSTGVSVEMEEI